MSTATADAPAVDVPAFVAAELADRPNLTARDLAPLVATVTGRPCSVRMAGYYLSSARGEPRRGGHPGKGERLWLPAATLELLRAGARPGEDLVDTIARAARALPRKS